MAHVQWKDSLFQQFPIIYLPVLNSNISFKATTSSATNCRRFNGMATSSIRLLVISLNSLQYEMLVYYSLYSMHYLKHWNSTRWRSKQLADKIIMLIKIKITLHNKLNQVNMALSNTPNLFEISRKYPNHTYFSCLHFLSSGISFLFSSGHVFRSLGSRVSSDIIHTSSASKWPAVKNPCSNNWCFIANRFNSVNWNKGKCKDAHRPTICPH